MNKSTLLIEEYNLFFTVTTINNHYRGIIEEFGNKLTVADKRWDARAGKLVTVSVTNYYSYDVKANKYRFPISQLKSFLDYVKGIEINKTFKKDYKDIERLDLKINPKYVPRPDQVAYREAILNSTYTSNLIDAPTGTGKALTLDTLVRVPNDWKKMKDIEVGDLVMSQDGTYTKVIGSYPQDVANPTYRVTLEDGRYVEACEDHLWSITIDSYGYRTLDTKTIIKLLEEGSRCYIPLVSPERSYKTIELDNLRYVSNLTKIPIEYMDGNIECKKKLLKTILDLKEDDVLEGILTFITPHTTLRDDIILLARSLGYVAYYNDIIVGNINKYTVVINTIPTKLEIVKLEYVGKKEVKCISVEHPSKLYVVQDYIVTHNTLIAMDTACKFNMRMLILVLPKYIDKWKSDVKDLTNIKDNELYIAQGGDSLLHLMELKKVNYKIIIMSLRTWSNYLNNYLSSTEKYTYTMDPVKLVKHLKIGLLFNDETHQHFHAVNYAMLYIDAKKFIGSSATFDSHNKNIRRVYDIAIPQAARVTNMVKAVPHIHAVAVSYTLEISRFVKYELCGRYSHIVYEESILKNPICRKGYVDMILYYLDNFYLKRRKEGDKCLLFFSSVNMCTYFTNLISRYCPKLTVSRYCQSDPYSNIITSDITCSTVISSGTAIDIPGLVTVIQTISIHSLQANIQAMGRLRKIADKETIYIWLYTKDIVNQMHMHKERYKLLKGKLKSYGELSYNKKIYTTVGTRLGYKDNHSNKLYSVGYMKLEK